MGTKVTSSSGSVLEEPEIQKLQMQAKIFKENSLNKLNALKSTTQLLERQTFSGCILYQQAFAQLFGDSVRTFKFQLSQHMNNLETLLNAETLHEMDSKSALSVIKVQFERFINSDLLKPLDIYSRSFSSDREQCIIERASHEQELKMTLKKLSERQLQIQQCKVQEVQSSVTSSGDETSSGIVSDEEIDKQELEAHYSYMAKIQRHSKQPESINDTYVLEKDDSNVIPDSSNICTNDNQVDQNAAECVDERAALANLIANLTLDTEENKTVLKQLKKANASFRLKECKTNLDETSRALGEATRSRDNCLIALQTKQTKLEKYTTLNDRTSDYKILQTKLNETLDQHLLIQSNSSSSICKSSFVMKIPPIMILLDPAQILPYGGSDSDSEKENSEFQDHNMKPSSSRFVPKVFSSSQDSYITTRVRITIPPSYSNVEDNSHKVVRLGINPMIQPEPEDLPKDNPKLEIAVLRVEELKINVWDKGSKEEVLNTTYGRKIGNTFDCQNHKLIADIENDIDGPSDACKPFSAFGFLSTEIVSFVHRDTLDIY
ncbi:hypothetical protein Tco_1440413 [Tanacetum coccineum]